VDDTPHGRFLGVAVGSYAGEPEGGLQHVVTDVGFLKARFDRTFDTSVLTNPTAIEARETMDRLEDSLPDGGVMVVVWSGHGASLGPGELRLLTTDSKLTSRRAGIPISELATACAASGANQLLLIIDSCFAGDGLAAADEATSTVMKAYPPNRDNQWVGVLAACKSGHRAYDGELGERVREVMTNGPRDPKQRLLRWSEHDTHVKGVDFVEALMDDSWGHNPRVTLQFRTQGGGNPEPMIPNPLHTPDASSEIVEHLLNAARAGDPGRADDPAPQRHSWFTGRRDEIGTLVRWVKAGDAGLRVITGSPGTGKTALLGRIVSLSATGEREALLAEADVTEDQDPGPHSVDAHVHARRKTADGIAGVLDGQLAARGLWTRSAEGVRNTDELLGVVRRRCRMWERTPVVVIDGLDEARAEAFDIARSLLVPLAKWATVIVSTRSLDEVMTGTSVFKVLNAGETVNLDTRIESSIRDIHDYVRLRLDGIHQAMDPDAVAGMFTARATVTSTTAFTVDRPFLLARLVTEQLRQSPVDTAAAGWQSRISGSITLAFEGDYDRAAATLPSPLIRPMLSALAWAGGAGLPEQEWICVAAALARSEVTRDDVLAVLTELGRYIVQDGESGQAVYRIFHQTLADHLRSFQPSARVPFDPQALPVAKALMKRYVLPNRPPYPRKYAALHAELAGPAGIRLLRSVAGPTEQVRDAAAAVATVCLQFNRDDLLAELGDLAPVVGTFGIGAKGSAATAVDFTPTGPSSSSGGYHPDAAEPLSGDVSPSFSFDDPFAQTVQPAIDPEVIVDQLRVAASRDSAATPAFTNALRKLAAKQAEAGRTAGAASLLEEAASLYRTLVTTVGGYEAELAATLASLGTVYAQDGRFIAALNPAREAVDLYRTLGAGMERELALGLSSFGIRLGQAGETTRALRTAEEAVALLRVLAANGDPNLVLDLGNALTRIGALWRDAGQIAEGLAVTEEAVDLIRTVRGDNRRNLASALNNLGGRRGDTGDHEGAIAAVTEAVEIYRDLWDGDPARSSELAGALDNLGTLHRIAGRNRDFVTASEEAALLYRLLAGTNLRVLPEFATALGNTSIAHRLTGRLDESLREAEEALTLWRNLTSQNDAYRRQLAGACNNVAVCLNDAGRTAEALRHAREALRICQGDKGLRAELASSWNNVGTILGGLGRIEEAIEASREAVSVYRELPGRATELANVLVNLGELTWPREPHAALEHFTEARAVLLNRLVAVPDLGVALARTAAAQEALGDPDAADQVWTEAIERISVPERPRLALYRSTHAEAGSPSAAEWIATALGQTDDRDLVSALHYEGRRHYDAEPAGFASAWRAATGQYLPSWCTVDSNEIQLVTGWVGTPDYLAERDYLAANPVLLTNVLDSAIGEVLLGLVEPEALRYQRIRTAARQLGVDAAYEKYGNVARKE
jgi:tetratricopeptide (TPR) repeat protein